jgi:hypothetical protein
MLTKEKVKELQSALEGLGLMVLDVKEISRRDVRFNGDLDKNYGADRLEPLLDESTCIYLEATPLPLQRDVIKH